MQSFTLVHPNGIEAAASAARADGAAYIAGGTDLMQLMKNNVGKPRTLVDLAALKLDGIGTAADGALRLGALATMSKVAAHPTVRKGWPAISQALLLSASPQIRNMGTIGGNLLQRTRCNYFRDTGFACNKREPGSGCPAINGDNRMLAVLGGSDHCIATHPSDMPVALIALDAAVELHGEGAARTMSLAELYRLPGDTPQTETTLRPGELITAVMVPESAAAKRSAYIKVRDRESFAFALVSAAVAIEVDGGTIKDARLAMGGVGTVPWRMPNVEAALRGREPQPDVFAAAAAHAPDDAHAASENGFKLRLMQRVAERALQSVAA